MLSLPYTLNTQKSRYCSQKKQLYHRQLATKKWIRRFESEEQREALYKAVYETDYWKNDVGPRIGEVLDRSAMVVQRVVPTSMSTMA